jgi:hypothetical protein
MGNTPAHPGPFDPLQDADPSVPFFPLMGTDPLAPPLVLEWADQERRRARGIEEEDVRRRAFAKCNEAEEIAWAMQRYSKTGSAEDVRARPTRATYSGNAAADDGEHERKERLLYATQSLREAQYYACEARDALRELGVGTEPQLYDLMVVLDKLHGVAVAHEVKRVLPVEEPKLPLPVAEASA